MAAPLVPLLDKLFKAKDFRWTNTVFSFSFIQKLKHIVMKPFSKKLAAFVILSGMVAHEAAAFCGFYVSKADGTLKNKTSQVILVRDGKAVVVVRAGEKLLVLDAESGAVLEEQTVPANFAHDRK